jgi:hypothetical protein
LGYTYLFFSVPVLAVSLNMGTVDETTRANAHSVTLLPVVDAPSKPPRLCEASDDAVAARFALQLGMMGNVRTRTLKAFPEAAYREIIASLG